MTGMGERHRICRLHELQKWQIRRCIGCDERIEARRRAARHPGIPGRGVRIAEFEGGGRGASHGEPPPIDPGHASHTVYPDMIAVAEAMRYRRRYNARVGLRNSGDRDRRLEHIPPLADHPHLLVAELEDIGLGRIELEGNQPRSNSRIERLADKLRAGPGARSAKGMNEPVEASRQTNLVLGEVDSAV